MNINHWTLDYECFLGQPGAFVNEDPHTLDLHFLR